MGIKGLNAFLRKECPDSFQEVPNSYFQGKRISVDSDNVLRRLMSRAHKEVVDETDVVVEEPDRDKIFSRYLYHCRNLVSKLLTIGGTPIFIFDGDYVPEKSQTQQKRRDERAKRVKDAEDLKMKIIEIDPLERTPDMITKLRKKMHHLSYLTTEEKEITMTILRAVGLPVLRATGEGEKLCAMLCIEGLVDAAYSTDTDLTAFGCPLTIIEPSGYVVSKNGIAEESFKCVFFKPILSKLNMEYETFLDLCIMSGCDFNENMRLVGIGRSYKILSGCKSIDNLPDKYKDKMLCLDHIKCREIFSHVHPSEICQDDLMLSINTDLSESRDILDMYGAEDWIGILVPLYSNLILPSNTVIPKRPSLGRSKVRLNIIRPKEDDEEEKTITVLPLGGDSKHSPTRNSSLKVVQLNLIQRRKLLDKMSSNNMNGDNGDKPQIKLNIINK